MSAIAFVLRNGTAQEHTNFTGLAGEVTYNTTTKTIHVHDGVTKGGTPVLTNGDNITALIGQATTATDGVVRLATTGEATQGTLSNRVVTPQGLKTSLDTNVPTLIKSALNVSGSAPTYACRAWVNFNGITKTINGSGNVASITDNGTGWYTINFSTAMPNQNFAVCSMGSSNQLAFIMEVSRTTRSVTIKTKQDDGGQVDPDRVSLIVVG